MMTENFMMLQLTLGRHDERVRGKGTKLLPKGEDSLSDSVARTQKELHAIILKTKKHNNHGFLDNNT